MRLQVFNIGTLVIGVLLMANFPQAKGNQELTPIQKSTQQTATANQAVAMQNQVAEVNQRPYKLSSRIHIQKGSTRGYLIVQVELKPGSYIYSLTQGGDVPPSKLTVEPAPNFRMIDKFSPDKPPTILLQDPVLKQRVEKHKSTVQFFAPIELAPGTDPEKVVAKVTFKGQVCSDEGFCMPVRKTDLAGKFVGYFERLAGEKKQPRPQTRQANQTSESNGTFRR